LSSTWLATHTASIEPRIRAHRLKSSTDGELGAVGWLQRLWCYCLRKEGVMETQWAVGWGTLALLNAGVAQGKNRSGLNWFLLSLLFGPLATFLLVLQPNAVPPQVAG
jgi:hypothetical protein